MGFAPGADSEKLAEAVAGHLGILRRKPAATKKTWR
jgi:hypothetical protein